MPGVPVSSWIALAFLAFIPILMATHVETRIALYVAAAWFAGLLVIIRLASPGSTQEPRRLRGAISTGVGGSQTPTSACEMPDCDGH